MSNQIIPLTTSPNQTIQVTLNINGENKTLELRIRYNEIARYWTMGIIEPSTGEYILDSIPLITGDYPSANILAQYAYLSIGAAYVMNVSNSEMDWPDKTNLGTDFVLVWTDNPIPALPSAPYAFDVPTFGFGLWNAYISGFDGGFWDGRQS